MSETTTKTTTKSVSFEVDGDITLLIKRWVMRCTSDEGKSLLLFFLATTMLVHKYLRSKMNDNLLALVANAIIVSDNYRLHNPGILDSIISTIRVHLMNCIGAVYRVNRITEIAFLEDTASKNSIDLCWPGANRCEKKIQLLDYGQWIKSLNEKFFIGQNVEAILNNLIEVPSKANDDFDFKSPFSMVEPTPSPVKPASVKKGAKVPYKKQTFAAKHAAKPNRVSLSPQKTKGPVKNPYIKKGRSMK